MLSNINDNNAVEYFTKNPTVIVDCFASWCGPCKMFAPIFEKVSQMMPEVAFAKVDVGNAKAVANHLSVRATPTVVIVKNNRVVYSKAGVLGENELISLIKQYMQ